jgi:hypothetical protein
VRYLAAILQNPQGIDAWLRQWWRIVPDPIEAEWITAPAAQLRNAIVAGGILRGDCDDAAVLAASLLTALGWPGVRLVAIRKRNEFDFSHVFVRVPIFEYSGFSADMQLDIDPIVPESQLPLQGEFESLVVEM